MKVSISTVAAGIIFALVTGCLPARAANEPDPAAASPTPTTLSVDYAALVSKADADGSKIAGLPIGNGRLATVVRTADGNSLLMFMNHADVFAFRSSSESTRDMHATYANCCGLVQIQLGAGALDKQPVQKRLRVYDAVAEVAAPEVRVRTFMWHRKDVLAVEITDERSVPREIMVDLCMIRPKDDVSGPHSAKSTVAADGQDIELAQAFIEKASRPLALDLNSFTALRAKVIGRTATAKDLGDRIRLTLPAGKGTITVLVSLGQDKDGKTLAQVKAAAKADLEEAAASGFVKMLDDNKAYWHDFWTKSFISMSGSPEVEKMSNFYTWSIYLAGTCMRGNFPAKFNGLLFMTQEKRDWGALYWWYNDSAQHGWQLAANHAELLEPVFRWNWRNRAAYANAAVRSWNSCGWYVPETSSWDGPEILPEGVSKPEGRRAQYLLSSTGGEYTARNTYNMARFAALYYQKYLYTGDEQWLKEKAYPAARATAEFYCGLKAGCQYAGGSDKGPEGKVILKKDADGKYHLYGTILHEHIWWGKDIIEDLAAIRGIFPVAIALSKKYGVDAGERAEWEDVLKNLAPYPMSDEPGAVGSLGPGTWAQGLSPHGNVRDNYGEESPRMGPVVGDYLDVLTLESPNKQDWALAMATLDKHPGTTGGLKYDCSYYSVVTARMGRPDLVERALPGMMNIVAGRNGGNIWVCDSMQGPGIFAKAAQSALLLSISPSPVEPPVIHVMDGWPRKWDVSFQLLAKGGFLVSSSLKSGTIRFVEIISQLGGECRIRNPWPGKDVMLLCNGQKKAALKDALLKFDTTKGGTYLLVAAPSDASKIEALRTVVPAPPSVAE